MVLNGYTAKRTVLVRDVLSDHFNVMEQDGTYGMLWSAALEKRAATCQTKQETATMKEVVSTAETQKSLHLERGWLMSNLEVHRLERAGEVDAMKRREDVAYSSTSHQRRQPDMAYSTTSQLKRCCSMTVGAKAD